MAERKSSAKAKGSAKKPAAKRARKAAQPKPSSPAPQQAQEVGSPSVLDALAQAALDYAKDGVRKKISGDGPSPEDVYAFAKGVAETVNPGRPSSYKPEFAKQAAKLCALGATDFELAEFFEVTTVTIWRWRNEHEAFCNACVVGKDQADDRVERSLYQRAVGYSYNAEKLFHFQGNVTRASYVEHVPPDPGAAGRWLAARRGDQWREKLNVEPGEGFKELWSMISGGAFEGKG